MLFYELTSIISLLTAVHCKSTPILNTSQGSIQGLENGDGKQWAFYGIPYATHKQRYQIAGPPPNFKGIFNATNTNIICKQYDATTNSSIGQEDCLILNVYTPAYKKNRHVNMSLPVMVFFHGGGYLTGSSAPNVYNPKHLVEKNVIVVTVNYRLGAFGFLCLKIADAPGNIGLKDKVAALKWLQANIKGFGGNPNSVTLFGNSAGAASVSILQLSVQAKGLFHRAIQESGSALSGFGFADDPIKRAIEVANRLTKCNKTDPQDIYENFKSANANDILIASNFRNGVFVSEDFHFRPCAENPGFDYIISKNPIDIIDSGDYYKIPIINGYNEREGIFFASFYKEENFRATDENFTVSLPNILKFKNEFQKYAVGEIVREWYFGDQEVSEATVSDLIDYISQSLIEFPTLLEVLKKLETSNKPIYNYYFKYDSNRNFGKKNVTSKLKYFKGATHTDELYYLFDPVDVQNISQTETDFFILQTMTTLWTNFAKSGNPGGKWLPSTKSELRYLNIDTNIMMTGLPEQRAMKFWINTFNETENFQLNN